MKFNLITDSHRKTCPFLSQSGRDVFWLLFSVIFPCRFLVHELREEEQY